MNISDNSLKKIAENVVDREAASILNLKKFISDDLISVAKSIYCCRGKVVFTGVGKSAIIAMKIVATFNSTGTPSTFMHSADAIHGDLGIIQPDDIVICISKSGNSPEIRALVPFIKQRGNTLIGMVSNLESYLALHSDVLLYTPVESEACPFNLVPTCSTTVQLVMGDVLAMMLVHLREFTEKDFAKSHPGGSLGKRLYMRVSDIIDGTRVPFVRPEENIQNTIINISFHMLGATVVLSDDNKVMGIITDGDVRRMIERSDDINILKASDIMSTNPKTIGKDSLAVDAFRLMERHKITSVIVLDSGKYMGLIHIHDIIREGIA